MPEQKQKYNTNITRLGKLNYSLLLLAVVFVLAASVTGYIMHKRHKQVAAVVVPTAYASNIPGWWYQQYFGASVCDKDICKPEADPDKDGLSNSQEYFYHGNPVNAHTSGDTMSDGELVAHNFDPSKKGRVTFDEASKDDSIVGESLVFDKDIKQALNDAVNPDNINITLIPDSDLIISADNSRQAISKYIQDSNNLSAKYFPSDRDKFIQDAMQSSDPSRMTDVQARILKTVNDLKKLPVPSKLSLAHKYLISFLAVLPAALNVPSDAELNDTTNVNANSWFDHTQQAFVIYQKMELEINRVKSELK